MDGKTNARTLRRHLPFLSGKNTFQNDNHLPGILIWKKLFFFDGFLVSL